MLIIFNWTGIAMIIPSLIIYFLFISIAGIPNSIYFFYLFNGVLLIVFDLVTRLFISKKYKKIKGGSFFFIPVYIIGVLCVLIGIYSYFA